MKKLLSLEEASLFASRLIQKKVTISNINYLIQYGRIDKVDTPKGPAVAQQQLVAYYQSYNQTREARWKKKLGEDINWALSFDNYSEAQTTKHVHRLHPYKGKYIPQLVEYFLDDHLDSFKRKRFFRPGDIVLDPFCGSGTTLVEANEQGMHAVGIDISLFNAQIANCKTDSYDIAVLKTYIRNITEQLEKFDQQLNIKLFEKELLDRLAAFNNKFFPSPEFKKKIYSRQVDEKQYGLQKEKEFLPEFQALAKRHKVKLSVSGKNFLDKWYMNSVRKEISFVNNLLEKVDNIQMKHMLQIILSRTIRSCRATTHSDLATLIQPVYAPYYCTKHKKICKPIFSILKWWKTYSTDTVKRLQEFAALRTPTLQHCFTGNSATLDIPQEIKKFSPALASVYRAQKIRGIFCSPPYIGLIDYHEQHAYAYETFHLPRKDEEEIGSMKKGNSKAAIQKYIQDIARVLKHCKKYLAPGYDVFLVANDKYNIYPQIAEQAGMRIVETFRRPVLNRTEKDKGVYSETIFRLREKSHA